MAEEGFNPDFFAPPASSQAAFLKQYVPADDDEGVLASFERVREFQPFLSQQQGKEIYKDVDYIRIVVRGNDKLEVHRPATESDKRRFPFAWQQYAAGKERASHGTPLDEIGVPPSVIATYHAKNVFTAEDLAQVTDGNLQNLPAGARDARHRARERVNATKATASRDEAIAKLQAENAQLRGDLRDAIEALKKSAKK